MNGTTTNLNPEKLGGLNKHLQNLSNIGVKISSFHEPDLGDQLTAFVFIVDERVFNKKDYPDFEDWVVLNYGELLNGFNNIADFKESKNPDDIRVYQEWFSLVGGERNVFLRDFLKNFKLA